MTHPTISEKQDSTPTPPSNAAALAAHQVEGSHRLKNDVVKAEASEVWGEPCQGEGVSNKRPPSPNRC